MTQGKCTKCAVAYRWPGARLPRLRDARCLYCAGPLERTTYLLSYRWIDKVPTRSQSGKNAVKGTPRCPHGSDVRNEECDQCAD
jgi:hypothetical protein